MKTTTRSFLPEKSTPGTHMFAEQPAEGEAPIIGSLYLQKFLFKQPGEITVTVGEPGPDLPAGLRVEFTKEKETKNTVRFQEVEVEGQPPRVKSLYLQKWFAGAATRVVLVIHA